MSPKEFLRTIEVQGLTTLVTDEKEQEPKILRLRDGTIPQIDKAYAPKTVKADISTYQIKDFAKEVSHLPDLRQYIEDYVGDYASNGANAFHLSNPCLRNVNNRFLTDLEYTVYFFRIKELNLFVLLLFQIFLIILLKAIYFF